MRWRRLLLRMLYSFSFFFFFSFHFRTEIYAHFSSMETSSVELKLNTMCRMVSIRPRLLIFGNLTCGQKITALQNFNRTFPLGDTSTHLAANAVTESPHLSGVTLKHCSEAVCTLLLRAASADSACNATSPGPADTWE